MINESYYELPEEKQKAILRDTILQTKVCEHNPISEAMLEQFVGDAFKLNNLQKDLYFEILKLKPEDLPIETFDLCFLTRTGFFRPENAEQEALHKVVAQENNKICLLMDYYMARPSVLEIAEDFPQVASCVAEVLLDVCQTLDHSRCHNCDLCTHKDTQTFTNFLIKTFHNENKKLDDFKEVDENWRHIQERVAFCVSQGSNIQLYFHRLIDRMTAKAGIICKKKDCLCHLGAEMLYKMSLTQRGGANGLN